MALNPPVLPGGLPMGIVGEMFFIEVSVRVKNAAQDCWLSVDSSQGHTLGVGQGRSSALVLAAQRD
jgi:hypothetical protein